MGIMPEETVSGAGGKSIPADYQAALAEERTFLARQRNILAVERTFSAWIRTALSLNAVALIMPRLIETGRWLGIERIIGVILTLTAAAMYYIALLRYHVASKKLAEHGIEVTPHRWVDAMIAALIFCTLLSLLLLFREL
jgi:putative membrane protein